MTGSYVFDTEAILAFLYSEPGHGSVADLLGKMFDDTASGAISAVTAAEVFYLVARFEGGGRRGTDD